MQRGAQTAPAPEQGSRMADLILEPLQHGEASVFPLSTPQFLKLCTKGLSLRFWRRGRFVHSKMKQPFVNSPLDSSCCRQPARSQGLPGRNQRTSVPPPGPSRQSLCTHLRGGGALAGACLLRPWGLFHPAYLGAPLVDILRVLISGVQGDSQVSWGFIQHSLCSLFPLFCLPAGS